MIFCLAVPCISRRALLFEEDFGSPVVGASIEKHSSVVQNEISWFPLNGECICSLTVDKSMCKRNIDLVMR